MENLNHATVVSEEAEETIHDMFEYHEWQPDQMAAGQEVRDALVHAFKIIINNVPPSPDRTVALRKLREARMDCNSAITHRGKY